MLHARSLGGADAAVAVFQHEALAGGDAHLLGGQEEHVGRRFAVLHFSGGDDDREEIDQTGGGQATAHGGLLAARGHGHGEAAFERTRKLRHRAHSLHFGNAPGKDLHLQLVHAHGIDIGTVLRIQQFHHILLLHSCMRIEFLFGEFKRRIMLLQRLHPRDVVQRHGVNERAVAVEDVGLKRVVRDLQGHGMVS